jgi:hypothetical protein
VFGIENMTLFFKKKRNDHFGTVRSQPPPAAQEEGRGGLLEAIRAAGGASGAGLKSIKVTAFRII